MKEPWFHHAPHKVLFCHIPLRFTRDIFPAQKRWECHDVCRGLWASTLAEAGVKVVVSGHTHDHRWMPVREGQPIGQLIGGGPQPGRATLIHGHATVDTLQLRMTKLDGTELHRIEFKA